MPEQDFSQKLCDERHHGLEEKVDTLFDKYDRMGDQLTRIYWVLVANLCSLLVGLLVGIGVYLVKQ